MQYIRDVSNLGIKRDSRVQLFIAHPDDETALLGGFMQKCVRKGAAVEVVCLTDGNKSTLRKGLSAQDSLAKVRRQELSRALRLLGVQRLVHATFPDGECKKQRAAIEQYMYTQQQRFRPTLLATFEPNGVYGHPDHIAISRLTAKLAKTHRLALLYATVDSHFQPDEGSKRLAGRDVTPLPPTVRLSLSIPESLRKFQAMRAHRSQFQVKVGSKGPGLRWMFIMMRKEFFSLQSEHPSTT